MCRTFNAPKGNSQSIGRRILGSMLQFCCELSVGQLEVHSARFFRRSPGERAPAVHTPSCDLSPLPTAPTPPCANRDHFPHELPSLGTLSWTSGTTPAKTPGEWSGRAHRVWRARGMFLPGNQQLSCGEHRKGSGPDWGVGVPRNGFLENSTLESNLSERSHFSPN